jgi:hypothetical protein
MQLSHELEKSQRTGGTRPPLLSSSVFTRVITTHIVLRRFGEAENASGTGSVREIPLAPRKRGASGSSRSMSRTQSPSRIYSAAEYSHGVDKPLPCLCLCLPPQDADGRIRGVRCVCPQSREGYFRCPWSPCNRVQLSTMSTGQCGRADAR